MSKSSSKPLVSGPLPGTRKWYESPSFRIVAYIIISAVCDGLLVAAANASQQKLPQLAIFFFSLAPGLVLGIAFAIIQNFDDRTRSLEQYVKSSIHTLDHLTERYLRKIDEVDTQNTTKLDVIVKRYSDKIDNLDAQ